MSKYRSLFLPLLALAHLAACSVSPVGLSADAIPPKLVNLAAPKSGEKPVEARAWEDGQLMNLGWDRPSAFGPVPKELQAAGDATCQKALYRKAIGYHPSAVGFDGKPIVGGGFFCGGGSTSK